VKHLERAEPVERVILERFDFRIVQIQVHHVLSADEYVPLQLIEIIAVQVHVRRVHRYFRRHLVVQLVRTVDDIRAPRLVVVTCTVAGARHLAVARVEFATFAHGKTVRLIFAQKLRRPGRQ